MTERKKNKALVPTRMPVSEFPVKTDYGSGQLLPKERMIALIEWARRYGLDAWLDHVCYYYGKPYVRVPGRLYLAHGKKTFRGYTTWNGSDQDKETHQLDPMDHLWYAAVMDSRFPEGITAFGIVRVGEMEAMSERHPDRLRSPVVAANPSHMAEKRALAKALERAYPLGVESVEEVELEGETEEPEKKDTEELETDE